MDAMTHARLETTSQFFKALSHVSWLYMIEKLLRSAKSVLELNALAGTDVSTVSKRQAVLRTGGIVRDGNCAHRAFYSARRGENFQFVFIKGTRILP